MAPEKPSEAPNVSRLTKTLKEKPAEVTTLEIGAAQRDIEESNKEAREDLRQAINDYLEAHKAVETENTQALRTLEATILRIQTRGTLGYIQDKTIDKAQDARVNAGEFMKKNQTFGFAMLGFAGLGLWKAKNLFIDKPKQAVRFTRRKGAQYASEVGGWAKRQWFKILLTLGLIGAAGGGIYMGISADRKREEATKLAAEKAAAERAAADEKDPPMDDMLPTVDTSGTALMFTKAAPEKYEWIVQDAAEWKVVEGNTYPMPAGTGDVRVGLRKKGADLKEKMVRRIQRNPLPSTPAV